MPALVCPYSVSQSGELAVVAQASVENEVVGLVDWTGAARLSGSPRNIRRASREIKDVPLSDLVKRGRSAKRS